MDTYKDYQRYKEENKQILNLIKKNMESTYILIEDIIEVLDYISKEKEKNSKLDSAFNEIFDYGYAFLSVFLEEMEYIYHEYFKEDIILLQKYDKVITYWFYIHDLLTYLEAEMNENNKDELKASIDELDKLLEEIDDLMKDKKEVREDLYNYYEEIIERNNPDQKHKDTFTIYSIIREDLIL